MSTYVQGSKIPFKPMNPWDRAMPKPSRDMQKAQPSLYQVHVDFEGKTIAVGPKMQSLEMAEKFCEVIGVQIGKGLERTWSNPKIVEFKPESEGHRDTRTIGDLIRQS